MENASGGERKRKALSDLTNSNALPSNSSSSPINSTRGTSLL